MYKKLVTIFSLAALSFVAMPSNGQVVAIAGYDIDWEGLTVGVGYNVPIDLTVGPVSNTMIRPSAEYVFAGLGDRGDYSVFRVSGELLGALSLGSSDFSVRPGVQQPMDGATPFVKAGLALERFSFDYDSDVPFLGGTSFSNTEIGLVLGGGVMFSSFLLEGTLGLGNISVFRIAAAYTFNI